MHKNPQAKACFASRKNSKSEDVMSRDALSLSKNNRILGQNADIFPADSEIIHIMLINESES